MRFFTRISCFLAAAGSAVSTPAGLFDVSPTEGEAYRCDRECQKSINDGNIADRKLVGTDFDFDFYGTASNFSSDLPPGEILKLEPLDPAGLDIDCGTTIYRIQYTSKDVDGSIVPSTGFIALPFTRSLGLPNRPEREKYRLVAYAHGAAGLYHACVPSNGNALYDQHTWIPLIQRGYAVVATDYAGLGNNYTSHKYIYHPVHVHDIKYSVVAARKAFGSFFTDAWMSIGRSQGGGAVWKLAESKHVREDRNYLGTVAIAPATYTVDMILDYVNSLTFKRRRGNGHNVDESAELNTGYLTFLVTAVERAFPEYKSEMLSEIMKKRVELAELKSLCTRAMLPITVGLNPLELVVPEKFISELPVLKRFQGESAAALGDRSPAPIMVIQGAQDTTITSKITQKAWNNSCAAGNELHLRIYELMEHKPVQTAAMPEFLGWMDGLFTESTHSSDSDKCTAITRKPFDANFVKTN